MIAKNDSLAIVNARIITDSGSPEGGSITVQDGRIVCVGAEKPGREFKGRVIDARDNYVSAGFIDLHVHGAAGANFLDGKKDSVKKILSTHTRYGTTGILATIGTAGLEIVERGITCLKDLMDGGGCDGLLGINLEGPYLNRLRCGAQPAAHIRKPDSGEMSGLIDLAGGHLKIVTLAPELKGGSELITLLRERGVVPAIGHSNANLSESQEAFSDGVRYVTHLFNAMSEMQHRHPGLPAAALLDDGVITELIADGIHVDPVMVRLALKIKDWGSIVLVTDCMAALDSDLGRFHCEGRTATVRDGAPRFDDGVLYGTVLTMNAAIKNVLSYTGCSIEKVIRLATTNPARVLGIDRNKGSVENGKDADLVIFDKDMDVKATVVGGKLVYSKLIRG